MQQQQPPTEQHQPRKRGINWLRIILLSTLMLAVTFAATGVGFSMYYGGDIQDRILNELNKKLKTQIIVRGPVSFSVFSYFPNASLQINDIVVMGSTGNPNDTLLKAKKLYLLMNIFDVVNKKWEIKSIVIENGSLNMQRHANGAVNYDITKNEGKQKDTSSIFVNIREAVCRNVVVNYNDKLSAVGVNVSVSHLSLEGNFSSAQLNIKTEGTFTTNTVNIKNVDYGRNKHVTLAGSFQALPGKNAYTINSDNIFIEDNHFSINGTITDKKEMEELDIKLKGIELSINGALKLFPNEYAQQFNDYNASGNLQFDVSVKGTLSKATNPNIIVNYKVAKTKLHYNKLSKDISDLTVDGSYTNGAKQNLESSEINIKNLSCSLGEKPFVAKALIRNLNQQNINIAADGYLGLDFFATLLPDSGRFHDVKGGISIQSFSYNGLLSDLEPTTDKIPDIKGNFTFKDAHIRMDTTNIDVANGGVSLTPTSIAFENLTVHLANSQLTLQGTVQDWKGYTYNLINSAPTSVKPMFVTLTADMDNLVLENWLNLNNNEKNITKNANLNSKAESTITIKDILNLNGTINVTAKHLSYKKFKAEDLKGKLILIPGNADLQELSMKTMTGNILLTSRVIANSRTAEVQSNLKGKDIDISELFYEMENFGQQDLTNKNLKGKLTTNTKLNISLTDGKIDMPKLYALAEIKIDNGELVAYPALKSLSKFIDIHELEDVKFSSLQNQIEIKDQVLTIPAMIIKSSALNLSVAGTHTFKNVIDYRIKINFFDILAGKIRKRKLNKDNYEVVDDNNFNFFISMKGPLDKPEIKYDRQGVVERFKQQGAEIKKNIKGIKESYSPDKEKKDWNTKDEMEFIDWDKK